MEHRVPTIFEVAEKAARKARPETGQRKLRTTRKASGKTSRRPPLRRKVRRAGKRKG